MSSLHTSKDSSDLLLWLRMCSINNKKEQFKLWLFSLCFIQVWGIRYQRLQFWPKSTGIITCGQALDRKIRAVFA